jgi:phospholipase/lecithinase/hemolysin
MITVHRCQKITMQKQVVALASFLFSVILPLKASAQNFDGLFIFGDSLVDTGKLIQQEYDLRTWHIK